MAEKFNFKEALSFMECGIPVLFNERKYIIEDGKIICYPMPFTRPKFKRVEVRFKVEWILSNTWSLYESSEK